MIARKTIIVFVLTLLVCSNIHAHPQLIVWDDSTHTDCSHFYSTPYIQFDVWVYANSADENGIVCAEFRIAIESPEILVIDRELNSVFELQDGENPEDDSGVFVCSQECQSEWTWIYKLTMLPVQVVESYILPDQRLPGHEFGVNTCEEGNPRVPVTIEGFCVNFNCGCELATKVSSWGAVKSLFK